VEEIEGGYFDKLRAAPISRSAIVLGRLYSEFVKSVVITTAMVLIAWPFGIHIESGVIGYVLLALMIALKTRSAAATNAGSLIFFPLLFLTPNFVPRDLLARPMEIAATFNPVTYVMEAARSLILDDLEWDTIANGFLVVACLMALMLYLSVRTINRYD
jgi:ABC-2 type transport system permease protein